MRIEDLTEKILELIGGKNNVCDVQNCMTRLRVTVADMEKVDVPSLMALEDVLGVVKENPIQIILGPGKVQKLAHRKIAFFQNLQHFLANSAGSAQDCNSIQFHVNSTLSIIDMSYFCFFTKEL